MAQPLAHPHHMGGLSAPLPLTARSLLMGGRTFSLTKMVTLGLGCGGLSGPRRTGLTPSTTRSRMRLRLQGMDQVGTSRHPGRGHSGRLEGDLGRRALNAG